MSDIPSLASKIQIEGARFRGPVSEALIQQIGGNINFLLDKASYFQLLTTSGALVVPNGITKFHILACGAGGGGGGGFGAGPITNGVGALTSVGGSGSALKYVVADVTPFDTITYTIGAGGAGGAVANNGSAGGDTIFAPTMNPTLTFKGAIGGDKLRNGYSATSGAAVTLPYAIIYNNLVKKTFITQILGGFSATTGAASSLSPAEGSTIFDGGSSTGWAGSTTAGGGGGGASDFGDGGNGATTTSSSGTSAGATAYGAGGGGAGKTSGTGGNGAGGCILIFA